MKPPRSVRRVIVLTKFRFLGDTLLAVPLLRAARQQWPDARLVLLTGPSARVLLQHCPYLDDIWEFDPRGADCGLPRFLRLVGRLRRERFNLALILNRSFHSALLPWLAGTKTRAGFRSEGRDWLLNAPVPYHPDRPEALCYGDVLRAAAPAASIDPHLELWLNDDERRDAQARLVDAFGETVPPARLVGMQPGASLPEKRWDAARFAAVAEALSQDDPALRFVLLGGPEEQEASEAFLAQINAQTRAKTRCFTGKCGLRGSLGLLSRLGLFLSADTGIGHCAVALDVPTLALFGPTNPRKWGAHGVLHRVLEAPQGIMNALTAESVLAEIRALHTAAWREAGNAPCVTNTAGGILRRT